MRIFKDMLELEKDDYLYFDGGYEMIKRIIIDETIVF